MSRRSVLAGAVGLAAAGALARPYIANAQAKTAVGMGRIRASSRAEDAAFKKTVEDYEKASGNKIDLQRHAVHGAEPEDDLGADQRRRAGPDLPSTRPSYILPQNAWNDKLVDVSDVVEPYRVEAERERDAQLDLLQQRHEEAQLTTCARSSRAPRRSTIWGDLVEKAGFKMTDIPKTWDDVWKFFKPVQTELRKKGAQYRKIYGCGLQITTVGPNDGNNLFTHFMIANGGAGHRHPGRQAAHRRSEGP